MHHHQLSLFCRTSYLPHLKFLLVAVPVQLLWVRSPVGPTRPRGARAAMEERDGHGPALSLVHRHVFGLKLLGFFAGAGGLGRLGGWKGSIINTLSQYIYMYIPTGWWFQTFLFSMIYGMSSLPLTSYFSRWLKHVKTTNQYNNQLIRGTLVHGTYAVSSLILQGQMSRTTCTMPRSHGWGDLWFLIYSGGP